MISCANKILSRSNNILSRRKKLKNKTRMSLPGFRRQPDARYFTVKSADFFYIIIILLSQIWVGWLVVLGLTTL